MADLAGAAERALRALLPIALGTAGLAGAAQAWAPLTIEGQPVSWPSQAWPLPLGSEHPADHAAAAAWTQLGPACFVPSESARVAEDGVVSVTALDEGAWAAQVGDRGLVAFTLVTHAAGAFRDADVVLNTGRFPLSDGGDPRQFDRQTVVAHELGHALGLGHPCGEPGQPACDAAGAEALMAPRLAPGRVQGPEADDAAGLDAVAGCEAPPWAGPGPLEARGERWAVSGLPPGARVLAWSAAGQQRVPVDGDEALLPATATRFAAWTVDGRGVQGLVAAPASGPKPAGGCAAAAGARPLFNPWLTLALLAGGLGRVRRPLARERS